MSRFAAAVALSACLLFLVQPLIAKAIFPWFGGSSGVWIAVLMFFQVCLLCGYTYAHILTARASLRLQAIIHCVLLFMACLTLPIAPSDAWKPDDAVNPAADIFVLLAANVGLPCLLLSATSPLLQAWYVNTRGGNIPLWMFALSNVGSLAALLSFPLLLEPAFSVHSLSIAWSVGFGTFVLICAAIAWRQRNDATTAAVVQAAPWHRPAAIQQALWVLFSSTASALLASATIQLTTNVAPVPLLWVVPLAVYLLTFIVSFSFPRLYSRRAFLPLVVVAIGCLAWLYANSESHQHIRYVIPLYLGSLFVICQMCHGELALRAPSPVHLTRFYLLIAFGGALGGVFVSVIAPLVFDSYTELPILLVVVAELALLTQWQRRGAGRALWLLRFVMIAGVIYLAAFLLMVEVRSRHYDQVMTRNFYGVLRVREFVEDELPRRSLVHGTINHGYQMLDEARSDTPVSYFSTTSGVGRVLALKQSPGPVRVGVIGLGVGVLASYAREGDAFRFYEIDQSVADIAQQHFTFVNRARSRGADLQILIGDGRLVLEKEIPQAFDLLAVDAFSSDAIPMHLLTQEAFELYLRHLKPDGVLAVHISNRYLNLAPVCLAAAERLGKSAVLVHGPAGQLADTSYWVLIAMDDATWRAPAFEGAEFRPITMPPSFTGWTDRYSSLWPVLTLE